MLAVLPKDTDRPRLSTFSIGEDGWEGDRRPKNILGDHCDLSALGESERADLFLSKTEVDVLSRGSSFGGGGGGCRGVMNLSAGFIVLICPLAIELMDPLRKRRGCTSIGTKRVFTGWPGRYGQIVVNGIDSSQCSMPSSNSYYIRMSVSCLCFK